MNNLPKISIITPSFNQCEFLEATIQSIISQNYPELEYIIIDGGSADGSLDIIKKYQDRLYYWVSEKDEGQSNAINKGIRLATGEIIAWLNSDDIYIGNSLWHIAEIYMKNQDAGLIIGNGYRYSWPSERLIKFCPRHMAFNVKSLEYGLDYILQPSTFITRKAVESVGLLREDLHYCMDWEWWVRIAKQFKVVLTDRPLSKSREYEKTKTSAGGFKRVEELRRIAQDMTKEECTPGALFYWFENLSSFVNTKSEDELYKWFDFNWLQSVWPIMNKIMLELTGSVDGFPHENSENVIHYLPYVTKDQYYLNYPEYTNNQLPKISVITPSYNQGVFLERTIRSVIDQGYPNLEYIVIDGGSSDESIDIIKKYEGSISYWISEKDNGPAEAINKGLKVATGEIIAWLNSDDCMSQRSLWEIAAAFSNSKVQVVYGHAMYIDENDEPVLVDHGYQKTKIYFGYQQSFENTIRYWNTVYMVPQPTVFFRKEIVEKYGYLNEQYKFIFDYEYFLRLTKDGISFHLIDVVQAFYRIHQHSKTSGFEAFYPELFKHSRMHWKKAATVDFISYFKSYIKHYAAKIAHFYPKNAIGRLMLITRLLYTMVQVYVNKGNPEKHYVNLVRKERKRIV